MVLSWPSSRHTQAVHDNAGACTTAPFGAETRTTQCHESTSVASVDHRSLTACVCALQGTPGKESPAAGTARAETVEQLPAEKGAAPAPSSPHEPASKVEAGQPGHERQPGRLAGAPSHRSSGREFGDSMAGEEEDEEPPRPRDQEARIATLTRCFVALDKDKSGHLDAKELKQYLFKTVRAACERAACMKACMHACMQAREAMHACMAAWTSASAQHQCLVAVPRSLDEQHMLQCGTRAELPVHSMAGPTPMLCHSTAHRKQRASTATHLGNRSCGRPHTTDPSSSPSLHGGNVANVSHATTPIPTPPRSHMLHMTR